MGCCLPAAGVSGLRKKFSRYSAEFKLSVLSRMKQEELSATQATTLFDILGGLATPVS